MSAAPEGPTKPRVLIVEDETLVSLFLADIIEDLGFEVVGPAAEREEALRLADRQCPDLAIVDISLQGARDGVEIGTELARRQAISLIFMSGHEGVEDWDDVQRLAPAAVLRKPCLPDQIEDAVVRALETHRRE